MTEGTKFERPTTLKECLQLLASLNQSTHNAVKSEVITRLKTSLSAYCKSTYLSSFDTSGSGYLENVLKGTEALLKLILSGRGSSLRDEDYGSYKTLQAACAQKYADALCRILFQCYAALYYLYFMTSEDLKEDLKGGTWSGEKVRAGQDTGQNLNQWLFDSIGKDSQTGILKRGFSQHAGLLSDIIQGKDLSRDALDSMVRYQDPGSLQYVLSGMMFICPWHHSKLGHAVMFLWTFCDKVQSDSAHFQQRYKDGIQSLCKELKTSLQPFVGGSDTVLSAVCQNNTELYSALVNLRDEPEKFGKYVDSLKVVLPLLTMSMHSMLRASANWNRENLKTASTAGPFKYGFVFKKNANWESPEIQSLFRDNISALITSLERLSYILYPTLLNIIDGAIGVARFGLEAAGLGLNVLKAGSKTQEKDDEKEKGKKKEEKQTEEKGKVPEDDNSNTGDDHGKTPKNPKTPVDLCTIAGGVLASLGFPAIGALGYGAIRLLP